MGKDTGSNRKQGRGGAGASRGAGAGATAPQQSAAEMDAELSNFSFGDAGDLALYGGNGAPTKKRVVAQLKTLPVAKVNVPSNDRIQIMLSGPISPKRLASLKKSFGAEEFNQFGNTLDFWWD